MTNFKMVPNFNDLQLAGYNTEDFCIEKRNCYTGINYIVGNFKDKDTKLVGISVPNSVSENIKFRDKIIPASCITDWRDLFGFERGICCIYEESKFKDLEIDCKDIINQLCTKES